MTEGEGEDEDTGISMLSFYVTTWSSDLCLKFKTVKQSEP